MSIRLEPATTELRASGKTSACGRSIGPEFDPNLYAKDESDGTFHVDGQLFGGQIRMNDVRISRQRSRHIQGKVDFNRLDLPALLPALGTSTAATGIREGHLSGHLDIGEAPRRPALLG